MQPIKNYRAKNIRIFTGVSIKDQMWVFGRKIGGEYYLYGNPHYGNGILFMASSLYSLKACVRSVAVFSEITNHKKRLEIIDRLNKNDSDQKCKI